MQPQFPPLADLSFKQRPRPGLEQETCAARLERALPAPAAVMKPLLERTTVLWPEMSVDPDHFTAWLLELKNMT